MMELINETRRVAKKSHQCNLCNQDINIGNRYFYQFIRDGGDVWEFKCHEDCEFLMKELWDYIEPYDYMDDTYFQEGLTSFCKHFICPDCLHYNKDYFNNCEDEEGYCLDKIVALLREYEVHQKRDYNNPIFVKWYLKPRKVAENNE